MASRNAGHGKNSRHCHFYFLCLDVSENNFFLGGLAENKISLITSVQQIQSWLQFFSLVFKILCEYVYEGL